ncbi:MAG: hypothetical protein WC617_12600 [Rhodanobacter sp.]|jgi:hypothetical protein
MDHLDPRIGTLVRGMETVYYAFVHGYQADPLEGSLEQVEVALGLRQAPSAQAEAPPSPVPARRRLASSGTALREYTVTVTPSVVTYAGGSYTGSATFGEYTVQVLAKSHAQALQKARRERRDEEGRFGVPASFKARWVRQ